MKLWDNARQIDQGAHVTTNSIVGLRHLWGMG